MIINKYGYDFEIECDEKSCTLKATDLHNMATVTFKLTNEPENGESYWLAEVEDWSFNSKEDRDIFYEECVDLYDADDESCDWLIDQCMHEFYTLMRNIQTQGEYRRERARRRRRRYDY